MRNIGGLMKLLSKAFYVVIVLSLDANICNVQEQNKTAWMFEFIQARETL